MSNKLISDILNNQELAELLEQEKFQDLYNKLTLRNRPIFTEYCLGAGIDPLDYLTEIPSYYLIDTSLKSLTLPTTIQKIDAEALLYAPLRDLYFQGTVEEFDKIHKQPSWLPSGVETVHCTDGDWNKSSFLKDTLTINSEMKIATGTGPTLPDPSKSYVGEIYCRTDTAEIYVYTGSQWILMNTTTASV